ncbi:MAG: hypothetical protein MJ252_03195 [archaeon]|nr:hypothetical protein [archaeon]
MSEEEKQKLNDGGKGGKDEVPEEEEEGCCDKCGKCIVACCKGIYACLCAIKDGFVKCCSCWFYPLKEKCIRCCDDCDKSLHPYKDPKHNPYDDL